MHQVAWVSMSSLNHQGRKVLFATSMVSMVLGSIHAFSVFLEPLGTMFETSRANVSLVYSFCLVFLTAAVLFGPAIYSRVQPATIYLCVALLGAIGTGLAGIADSLDVVLFGYSFIFGIANGLGYGFGLQFAARANPDHSGYAMGVVTAAYAFGAVLAPYGFEIALAYGGFFSAMIALGSVVVIVAMGAALLIAQTGAQYHDAKAKPRISSLPWVPIAMTWIAYGSGVTAGLMAIGHAAGIAESAGFSGWIAAAVIAGCNLVGSLLTGWLSDRVSHRSILTILPLLGAVALLMLSGFPNLTVALLGVVGFAYGGIIATYPAAIAILFPGENGPYAYGRIFTAWGAAGLLAPFLAGQIYDLGGSYSPALWLASGLGFISAVVARKSIMQS
jgi:OFA family oxalate/formate antiporter-like MFS transporter